MGIRSSLEPTMKILALVLFCCAVSVLGGGHGNHAGSMGKEKIMEAMKGHSVDNCWKRENGIDIHHVCDVKTLKMYGMDAEPGASFYCAVKMGGVLDEATGSHNSDRMKAMMVNGLHLTAEQKAKAVVLADKCCSKIDKSVPKKGWLALQMVECVQRAILMATDYKGCPESHCPK